MKTRTFLLTLLLLCSAGVAKAQTMQHETPFEQPFPQGGELPAQYSRYFTGRAWLAAVSDNAELGTRISNVTFEPACRNNWHSHSGGQLLLITAGRGYYQAEGEPARELRPGDAVEIAPGAVHWHGAAPDSWFAHLAVECNPASNRNTWLGPVDDAQYAAATAAGDTLRPTGTDAAHAGTGTGAGAVFDPKVPGAVSSPNAPGAADDLARTDPELASVFDRFRGEVGQYGTLDARRRLLVVMASTIALQARSEYLRVLDAAWEQRITPVEIKEVLYHAVPYAGMGKVHDFILAANDFLRTRGVGLPVEGQATTSSETRFERGLALQKSIFGPEIERMHRTAPENRRHIQRYLSANCFGDYQTRTGLDVPTRELLTFSILVSLAGCESQVKAHIRGNVEVGNDKETLLAATTQLLPWIGYPRTLNALACLDEVLPE